MSLSASSKFPARQWLSRKTLTSGAGLIALVALVKLLAHLLVAGNFGYFRDELYYIDSGRHFQTGYVDFLPFIAWLAGILRIFGDNLILLHIISALAGTALVIVTGLMAREMGGGRVAQGLAALATAVMVTFLATGSLYTMDVFDELWWGLAAYAFILLVTRQNPKFWLLFGLITGVGLFTKLTMLFFGFGLVVGVLLTSRRNDFRTRWPWLGGAIAFAFLVPWIIWESINGWPTVEFWGNYGGFASGSPLDFLISQLFTMNLFNLPLVIAAFIFYFRRAEGKPYRALGWLFVVLYVFFTLTRAKSYFLSPAYPILFAGGAVVLGQSFTRYASRKYIGIAYTTLLVASGVFFGLGVMPVLGPQTYSQYYGWVAAVSGANQTEGGQVYPQILGDRLGWDTMTATVASAYAKLPANQRAQACILTLNYGEASALNFFGAKDGLPPVISGHNNYYLWGPGNCSGTVLLTVGYSQSDMLKSYGSVTQVATITCKDCQPEENNLPVYLCTQPQVSPVNAWKTVKHFN
jgi:4-amino-4-deoxy-L-arabinose transferase-like glycosyltransferase